MIKNVLALIGLYVVARQAVKGFNKHVRAPLEQRIADILEEESRPTVH